MVHITGDEGTPLEEEAPAQYHEDTMEGEQVEEGGPTGGTLWRLVSRRPVTPQQVQVIV